MSALRQHVTPPRSGSVPRALVVTLIAMLAVVAVLLAVDLVQLVRTSDTAHLRAPLTVHVLGDCQ